MEMLRNSTVKGRYDVVVVGAGIGGLTSAALLAKNGLDVLLVEQHYLPGGCCSAIRRNDVTMDVGSTVLYGFGDKGLNVHRYVMNELGEDIDMIRRESMYRLHVGERTITFWYDFDRFLCELTDLFPHQREQLAEFFEYGRRVFEGTILQTDYIVPMTEVSPQRMMQLGGPRPEMMELMKWMNKSGMDLFQHFFSDPELIAFFDMLTRTFSYVDAEECPAILSLTMFADNHIGGAFYPHGSPQMLPNKLERAVERHGGTIVYRNAVDEVLISDGRATGVRLADGTTVEADFVVANATIWNLYGRLVREQHIRPERMQWAQAFKPSHSNLILYIQLQRSVLPDDLQPMEVIIENPEEVDGHGVTVYLPSLIDPSLAPEGICSVTVTCVSSRPWPSPSDAHYRDEEYQRLKQQEAEEAIARVEKRIPGFGAAIVGMEIATPTTLERFTLRNWGTVGGPKQMMGQDLANRPSAATDWKRLYLVGDSTVMGIGVLPATISGVGAVNVILRELGKPEYIMKDFDSEHVHIAEGKPLPARPAPGQPIDSDAQAMRLARDCQHCENAACVQACPASIDLVGFLRRVESGNLEGAAASMREMNPLSEICGHACPAEKYCEQACIRNDMDGRAVRISDIHGYVCGEHEPRAVEVDSPRPERVAVIGAGPAGLSCAHFLGRLGVRVDVLDDNARPGGLLSHAVRPDRASDAMLERELKVVELPGVQLRSGTRVGRDVTLAALREQYDAVFVAVGLWSGRRLDIEGADADGVVDAFALLRERRDRGAVATGERVVIVGGGSVAADAAGAVLDAGARRVDIVCLEAPGALRMLASERRELEQAGATLHHGWGPTGVGTGEVTFARCRRTHTADGRFDPELEDGEVLTLPFDQLVFAVGQRAPGELAGHLQEALGVSLPLPIDPETQMISGVDGVYAGGDIVRGAGTIVEAVADGRRAARAICARLDARAGRRSPANAPGPATPLSINV